MIFPMTQCAFRIRVFALASVRPTTCGTVHAGRTGGGAGGAHGGGEGGGGGPGGGGGGGGGAGGGGGGGGSPVHSGYAKLAIRVRQSKELVLA